ncbi:MAG: alkaline phosphatase D family protein [Ferruginibacter sp.]
MKSLLFILSFFIGITSQSQIQSKLISGPWAGNVELRNATIWAEVSASVKTVSVKYFALKSKSNSKIITYRGALGNDFNPVKLELNGLEMNTAYGYTMVIDGKETITNFATKFTTKDLWQWRKPAPDFSFLAGSCAYFNEPIFDRPGKPYGSDSSIFEIMANTPAAFHVWMGDNWYTREVDFYTAWGLKYRASRDRSMKVLQKFMASMPQYSIWDDHDYGPDNSGKSYILKEESRKIFMNYSLNPSYGEEGKGIYTKVAYADVDLFLTDDRYFRSEDDMPDSIDGKLSATKTYFGATQLEWLKNALLYSKASFKIIISGSQVLNTLGKSESMRNYSYEYNSLMNFLSEQKINGVIFFSGDRHHSEVIKMDRNMLYPMYDVTISPYTAGVSKVSGAEINNPFRQPNTLVEAQNFGKISVSGLKNERLLKIEFIGLKGELMGNWQVSEKELKNTNP